jgi:broad specificity phosphatase PhoE
MIELILIRHGQTPTHVASRWEGWGNTPNEGQCGQTTT